MKMDPEVKAKWVAALRSGEYDQTTGKLKRTTGPSGEVGYCCLGVLTDLASQENVCEPFTIPGSPMENLGWVVVVGDDHDYESTIQPASVSDWSGLGVMEADTLAEMNDGGAPFDHIAEYIETNL